VTQERITPLRQRMIEDMSVRQLSANTQLAYLRAVVKFARFLGRSPDRATVEDLRLFQLHLTSANLRPATINVAVAALHFLFNVTLDRPAMVRRLTFVRNRARAPVILSPEEVVRFLDATPGAKYKAAFSVAYGAGLRVSEVVSLKVSDIDSRRMLLRVDQGKGRKDRQAILSPKLLELLRDWWRISRPKVWLFPGRDPSRPLTTRQMRTVCAEAARKAGITKTVSPHTLRHCFATHLLENGADIRVIQVLLGHARLISTVGYAHVATNTLRQVTSPLDRLKLLKPESNQPLA
jgi:integrase/recombinase XerD